jgi:hypothetical protein
MCHQSSGNIPFAGSRKQDLVAALWLGLPFGPRQFFSASACIGVSLCGFYCCFMQPVDRTLRPALPVPSRGTVCGRISAATQPRLQPKPLSPIQALTAMVASLIGPCRLQLQLGAQQQQQLSSTLTSSYYPCQHEMYCCFSSPPQRLPWQRRQG